MKSKKIILILIFGLTINLSVAYSQTEEKFAAIPTVGEPMPNFALTDVDHFSKKQVKLDDFKGKWLFLDFWFKHCTACINAFPKMNNLQEKFKDKLNIVLVGQNGDSLFKGKNLKEFYESMRRKMNYNLISAYDSVLAFQWNIQAMPHIIIIDPSGKVYAKTNGSDLSEEKVDRLLNNKPVQFAYVMSDLLEFEGGPSTDSARLNPNLISRSILYRKASNQVAVRQTPIDYQFYPGLEQFFKPGERGYKAEGRPLFGLYNTAYFGKQLWHIGDRDTLYNTTYLYPVLEMKDKSLFRDSIRFNYALTVPAFQQSPELFKKFLQQDLERAFGYKVHIEKRQVPVWVLQGSERSSELTRMKDSSDETIKGTNFGQYRFKNMSFKTFLSSFASRLPAGQFLPWTDERYIMPLVNESGIDLNLTVDIAINGRINKMEEVNREIQKYDLKLIKGLREYWVLVIKDPDAFSSNSSKNIR